MPGSARERARSELVRDIKRLALHQLAESGAADLSLRAIARELGMVSSALYRYFRSRDDLLTALIVEAYADLAGALEVSGRGLGEEAFRTRWTAACSAMRSWAVAQPHRFALVYGSPVPGYRAPADTIAPAERVMRALAGIVDAAAAGGGLDRPGGGVGDAGLDGQLEQVAQLLGPHLGPAVLADTVAAFGQLVGMVNLELGGHFVGGFEPADGIFRHAVERTADVLGLQDL